MQTFFTFILGREYKLSIAELLAVFPLYKNVFWDKEFLVLEGISKNEILEKANNLGGTIKIIEILETTILQDAENYEGKFKYGISVYGNRKNDLKNILIQTKKELKNAEISSRFVNKDFKNLSSAQIIGEKLVGKGSDYNFVFFDKTKLFGKTVWIQDINAYSKRDFSKDRDMQTGMLPPKLAQMMINIGAKDLENPTVPFHQGEKSIFDPFVGLGTILIEADLMGFKNLYGSDLNEKMVEFSRKNLEKSKIPPLLSKGGEGKTSIEKLNAKFINESTFLNKSDLIVTEGYLGEIMTQKNISIDRINKQKESLLSIYKPFFTNLQKSKFNGNIVISFPFWELNGKYAYFDDIYEILSEFCEIQNLFPNNFENLSTKAGSLLYKREKQLVGREIFKLKVRV